MTRARMTPFGEGLARLAPVSVASHASETRLPLPWGMTMCEDASWCDMIWWESINHGSNLWNFGNLCAHVLLGLQVINFVDVMVAIFQVSTVYIKFHTCTCRSVTGSTSMLEDVPTFIELLFWWHDMLVHAHLRWNQISSKVWARPNQKPSGFCRAEAPSVHMQVT